MDVYDIAVVGAGPAGLMAGIRAAEFRKKVILIERKNGIGRKILLSGKRRCNITNIAPLDEFMAKFGKGGEFLRSAFAKFFNQDLIGFFKAKGLELKVERQGRVFPATGRADSVIDALKKYLKEYKVEVLHDTRVRNIEKEGAHFKIFIDDATMLLAKKVILSTGGKSFADTGSSGDGFTIAGMLGHAIVPLKPGMVPLRVKEGWVKEMEGLILRNVRLAFRNKNKKFESGVGELQFSRFGVSGPLVLDLSRQALDLLGQGREISLEIDLKPGLTYERLQERMVREFKSRGNETIKNILKSVLPLKLITVFVNSLGLDYNKKANQAAKEERREIVNLLKKFTLRITGSLPLEEAMVTCGGVCGRQINPRTMESRIVPGLYFAGEIIDASSPESGGYNLQQAFSTGYLAGESAALL